MKHFKLESRKKKSTSIPQQQQQQQQLLSFACSVILFFVLSSVVVHLSLFLRRSGHDGDHHPRLCLINIGIGILLLTLDHICQDLVRQSFQSISRDPQKNHGAENPGSAAPILADAQILILAQHLSTNDYLLQCLFLCPTFSRILLETSAPPVDPVVLLSSGAPRERPPS